MKDGSDTDRRIPRTMSTQHPDNARIPDWCETDVVSGDAEIHEAYFAYNTLGCHEVMWDSEGKDVDTRVVRKLLTKYEDYFKEHVIGKNLFLTYRIPNPRIESVERKVVVETLQNIPVAYDVASTFYGKEVAPIFEVILPFTTDGAEPIRLSNYYEKSIVAAQDIPLDGFSTVKDWLGPFKPERIRVIPLVEDFDSMLNVDKIVEPYIDATRPRHLRTFVARSDPALNYGLFSAVLLSKLALSKLGLMGRKRGVSIHPILGVGSMPFRGHLSPSNLENFLHEYEGISTVTIQSALKYDYPPEQVKEVVGLLNKRLPSGESTLIETHEEESLLRTIRKGMLRYQLVVEGLAPLVNSIASYVPQRRARKLHIGLFGYSRNVSGVILPRAIAFTAILYSLGIPPELIGGRSLLDLTEEERSTLQKYYVNLETDLKAAGGYLSWQNINMLMDTCPRIAERAGMSREVLKTALTNLLDDLKAIEGSLDIKLGSRSSTERKHENFAGNFLISYLEHEDTEARTYLLESAKLRRYLG